MFKIEDDLINGHRALKIGEKVLIKWYRPKVLFQKLNRLTQVVSMLAAAHSSSIEAQGVMRDIQKIQVKFLDTFTKFAQDNQITFWLDFGTLIGAARTNRFIPWDDDIDLSVPRNDYLKLLELSNLLPDGYYFEYAKDNSLLKLKHKDLPKAIGLDLFAADFVTNEFSVDESVALTKKIFTAQESVKKKPLASRKLILDKFVRGLGLIYESDWTRAKMLCYGTEFRHTSHPSIFISNEYIFPLSSIEFEGKHYPCPKQIGPYLTLLYRDYRSADWSRPLHSEVDNFTMKELLAISKFVQDNNLK